MKTKSRSETFDEYLDGVKPDQRIALEQLRRTIHAAAPAAEEYISYGLAAFRLDGRPLIALGAAAHHCAIYPMSSSIVPAFRAELAAFDTSKGTIRFPSHQSVPSALVRKLVKARIAENAARATQSKAGSKAARPARGKARARREDDVPSVLKQKMNRATQ